MADNHHRISAAALRSRELVRISGRGPTWAAQVTKAGREYLARVDGPDPPIARQANVSVAERLVDDVTAAGGSLRVPRKGWNRSATIDYAHRVRLAGRHGKVPPGKRLTVTVTEARDELEIRLIDAPDGAPGGRAELAPVAVPVRVGRYHAAARQFRDHPERHEVSRALLPRATRIIHALAVEAERRGWSAHGSGDSNNGHGRTDWTGTKDGHLGIVAQGHVFWVRMQEEGVRARGDWEAEVQRYRNASTWWSTYTKREHPSGPYDAGAGGRLKLQLHDERWWMYRGRQSRWADRQSWTLEERLPHLFREIEERVAEADRAEEQARLAALEAAQAAKGAAEERERTWQRLMDEARGRLVEDHRATLLRDQVDAWHEAERVRRYCDAVEEAFGNEPATAEWLGWARAHAAGLDPLAQAPVEPEPPEATPEALQRHLPGGWSAYGPEHGR